ncbi:MFS transporter [Desulfosporosinus sp. FKA]|uniref:MFS transporter n=1 Tax=Desulfosporosinus sp. FKA TaxID=1969834 RepID=UPI000B4A21C8|nr:MFS transporter [Desulfosporosinus sp. FKA]
MNTLSVKSKAVKFVLLIGIMSFFADFTYEGSRGIIGPYFALLGASAFTVALITGFGEFLGYAWRLVSGSLADKTGKFWPITIFGYIVQMASVPLLALAGSWQMAAVLVILERFGRATRNPPRDVMLSHAAKEMGYGWAFGVHEALDQFGALFGPLLAAGILAWRGDYRLAFAMMLIPALVMLSLLAVARWTYPHPEDMDSTPNNIETKGLPRVFWLYLAGAILVAVGFADFPFMAYHFQKMSIVSTSMIPVFYAVAMGVSGVGSLLFGRLFDRYGLGILVPLTIFSALFAPLVFLGGFWAALVGIALWGLGMGVHESIIPAAVAIMVSVQRRGSAYGLFTAGYGIFWFLGSILIGLLYTVSLPLLIGFCLITEFAAIPFFLLAKRQIGSYLPK